MMSEDIFEIEAYREMTQRLRLMQAYIFGHYDHDELFSDLKICIGKLEERIKKLKPLVGKQLSESEKDQVRDCSKLIQLGQGFFSDACQLYFRGSSADLFSSHHVGHGFASSAHLSMKALNFLARQTIATVRTKSWEGFALFSDSLSFEAALGEIIVQPFTRGTGIEFIQDWLIMSHEIGHIYYWGEENHLLTGDFYKRTSPYFPSLLSEYLADMFGLSTGYFNNPIIYAWDFDRVRAHYQSSKSIRFFSDTFALRMAHILAYYLFRKDENSAREFLKIADEPPKPEHDELFYDIADKASKQLAADYPDIHERATKSKKISWTDWVRATFVEAALIELYKAKTIDRGRNMVKMTVSLAANSALKTPVVPALMPPTEITYDRNKYRNYVKEILAGRVVMDPVKVPFALLYELTYHCYLAGIDIDDTKMNNTRIATILSLCGN